MLIRTSIRPNRSTVEWIIDKAIQTYGAAGVSQDTPLAALWAGSRTLRLADGPLTVYDLESLQAAPRVVILACCDGGLSNVLPGDELMGFAACLLAQGTASLIAPVLPVPDEDAQAVMLALHRRLRTGEEPCAALAGTGSELPEQSRPTAQAFACIGR